MPLQGKIGWRTSTSTPVLDRFLNSAGAYSLRKLSNNYSSFAIRVRRSSDNTEQNIGFDSSGNLDTSALTTFVGSGNGFITTWYDQSGNTRNLTQTTAATQPQIVSAGTLVTSNGKAAISFTGGRFVSGSVPRSNGSEAYSMYVVYRLYSTSRQGQFQWGAVDFEPGAIGNGIALHRFAAWVYITNNSNYWSTNLALGSVTFTGGLVSNHTLYYNGSVATGSVNSDQMMSAGGTLNIGKGSYSSANSAISEVILYPTGDQNANVAAINESINAYYGIYAPTVSDSDAQAFLNAALITNQVQADAINTLVTSLKSAGVWTKMRVIYPFVGGSASSHKFNLKDPRDLNAAFRLTFSGGWTHSSTGAKPNGTDAFANTFLATRGQGMANDSMHMSVYLRTDTSVGCDIGGGQTPNYYNFIYAKSGSSIYAAINDGGFTVSNSSSTMAFYLATRNNSTQVSVFRNGTKLSSTSSTRTSVTDMPLILGALNNNGFGTPSPTAYSSREQAFVSIGDGLTDAEALAFYNAIQAYQTALGRQV